MLAYSVSKSKEKDNSLINSSFQQEYHYRSFGELLEIVTSIT